MNRLPLSKRCELIRLLVEGNSLRACSRIADVSYNTVLKLLVSVGYACQAFHNETIVKVKSQRVQCDEIWSFVYAKARTKKGKGNSAGDAWTFVAIDQDTKLVISWHVGQRDAQSANIFMHDLGGRLATRVQLATDGFLGYEDAVADTFGSYVDYAQLVKQYSANSKNKDGKMDKRLKYTGAERRVFSGKPNISQVTTAHIERQNLTMRMGIRRFTRESNGFSKKMANHNYAIALHFVYYNFARIHHSLRITPAMEAKITKSVMKIADIAALQEIYLSQNEPTPSV